MAATGTARRGGEMLVSAHYTILDSIPGVRGLPEKDRAEAEKDIANSPEFPDMVIEGPIAVVTPIAIYR